MNKNPDYEKKCQKYMNKYANLMKQIKIEKETNIPISDSEKETTIEFDDSDTSGCSDNESNK